MVAAVALLTGPTPEILGREGTTDDEDDEITPKDLDPKAWIKKFEWLSKYETIRGSVRAAAAAPPRVPLTTLRRRYALWKTGENWQVSAGRPPTFEDKTEKVLVDIIEWANKQGHPVTKDHLMKEAKRLAIACGGKGSEMGVGSKGWLRGFEKRQPEVFKVNRGLLETERAHAISREAIERYFDIASVGLEGIDSPELIFFMDETYVDMQARTRLKVRYSCFFTIFTQYLTIFTRLHRFIFAERTPECTDRCPTQASTTLLWGA